MRSVDAPSLVTLDQVFAPNRRFFDGPPTFSGEDVINTRLPLPPARVFTRAEARRLGWSDEALTRAVASGRLLRVRHGLLTAEAESTPDLAALAATMACKGSVISHRSALALYGLPVVGAQTAVPELTVPPRRIGSLTAGHLHRATLSGQDVCVVAGQPLTAVPRTLIDVARARPLSTGVAAIDAALRRHLVRPDELEDVLRRCWNWPGIRRAQRAVRLSDGRSESPLESVSRLVIGWLGLPPPELQPLVLDEQGRPIARLDFYWDEFGVAGEADGRSKYDSRAVLTSEKERQERAEDLAVVFARWGWSDTTRPAAFKRRLERAFERGQLRDRSGLRRRWSIRRN